MVVIVEAKDGCSGEVNGGDFGWYTGCPKKSFDQRQVNATFPCLLVQKKRLPMSHGKVALTWR